MSTEGYCPNCEATDVNWYGVEVPGFYDGVLIWECQVCSHLWPRFPEGKRHDRARELIEKWRTDESG